MLRKKIGLNLINRSQFTKVKDKYVIDDMRNVCFYVTPEEMEYILRKKQLAFIPVGSIDNAKNRRFLKYMLGLPVFAHFDIAVRGGKRYRAQFVDAFAYQYESGKTTRAIRFTIKEREKNDILDNKKKSNLLNFQTENFTLSENRTRIIPKEIDRFSTSDPFYLFEQKGALKTIQLLRGSNNHVSRHHRVENRKVYLVRYVSKTKKYEGLSFLVQYCRDCNVYFDFYNSFMSQLKKRGIKFGSLMLKYTDERGKEIEFSEINLREYSKLNMFGYSVSVNGLTKLQRQRLIKKLIHEHYMSPAEIKNRLDFLIRFQGSKINMANAKECWLEDLLFVNELVLKKR